MHDGPLTGSLCVAVSSPQGETEARVPSLPFLLGGEGAAARTLVYRLHRRQ